LVPFNYETFFSSPSLVYTPYIHHDNFEPVENDPQGRHFVYTPYRLIHIYNPEQHKHFLDIHQKLPRHLKKKYKTIYDSVDQAPSKAIKIEPWTLCYHQTKQSWEPCQEWIDYLKQIYDFQQETSTILKKYRMRVSS
jgi:hypothetical protein